MNTVELEILVPQEFYLKHPEVEIFFGLLYAVSNGLGLNLTGIKTTRSDVRAVQLTNLSSKLLNDFQNGYILGLLNCANLLAATDAYKPDQNPYYENRIKDLKRMLHILESKAEVVS